MLFSRKNGSGTHNNKLYNVCLLTLLMQLHNDLKILVSINVCMAPFIMTTMTEARGFVFIGFPPLNEFPALVCSVLIASTGESL